MSKKKKQKTFVWNPPWSRTQLFADLAYMYAKDWAKALKRYEKNPNDFFNAYRFLEMHPANTRFFKIADGIQPDAYSNWEDNHCIMVVKVDPTTKRMATKKNPNWKKNKKGKHPIDKKRNTLTNVWIEWGAWVEAEEIHKDNNVPITSWEKGCRSHDPRVDTGGDTYEEAVIALAHNIHSLYGSAASVPYDKKLSKKDRK